ncbi:hypothetical protein BC941DRAFT_411943 [Chlamydoabsidia padenii]|nr:hypothetical protein BC941DRAFT_411943 [Chlamydoabsidia padenii]
MGLKYREYFQHVCGKKVYGCLKCKTHLTIDDMIISEDFNGFNGPAYLVNKVVNVIERDIQKERIMTSGTHLITPILCIRCLTTLGWKYIKVGDNQQKFKEGKYILEKTLLQVVL